MIWTYGTTPNWGIRSVGRAYAYHARGLRIDSGILHIEDMAALIAQLGERQTEDNITSNLNAEK